MNGADPEGLDALSKILPWVERAHWFELIYKNLLNPPPLNTGEDEDLARIAKDAQEVKEYQDKVDRLIEEYKALNKQAEELVEWLKKKKDEEPDT